MAEHTVRLHVDGDTTHGDLYVSGFATDTTALTLGHGIARMLRGVYHGAAVTVQVLPQPADVAIGSPAGQPEAHRQFLVASQPVSALARDGHAEIIEVPPPGSRRDQAAQVIAVVPAEYAQQVQEALIRAYELGLLDPVVSPAEDRQVPLAQATPAEKAAALAHRLHETHRVHQAAGLARIPDCAWCAAEDPPTPAELAVADAGAAMQTHTATHNASRPVAGCAWCEVTAPEPEPDTSIPLSLDSLGRSLAQCLAHDDVDITTRVFAVPEFGAGQPQPVSGVAVRYLAGSPELAATPPTVVIEYQASRADDNDTRDALARQVRAAWDAQFTGVGETAVDVAQAEMAVDTVLAALGPRPRWRARCVDCGHLNRRHTVPSGHGGAQLPLQLLNCPECPDGRCTAEG